MAESTLWHNQHCGTINPAAQATLQWSEHCGTINPPAQWTLQQSQHCSTINSLAQSPFWLNIAAESTLWHNQPFRTFIILAQSTVRHNQQIGTIIIAAHCWKHPDMPLHNSMIDARLVHSARIIIVPNCWICQNNKCAAQLCVPEYTMFTPWMPLPLRHRTPLVQPGGGLSP